MVGSVYRSDAQGADATPPWNTLCFIDDSFSDLQKGNVDFHCGIPQATFWGHLDKSIFRNKSKKTSKIEKHHVSLFSHPFYLLYIRLCDFWLSGMLTGLLQDRECNSSHESEEAMTKVWDEFTGD
jgi:hypothetical protein